jgi:hypothetical protein
MNEIVYTKIIQRRRKQMYALKLEKVDSTTDLVRAVIINIDDDTHAAFVDNIFEAQPQFMAAMISIVYEQYPTMNAVLVGSDEDARNRPGVTLVGPHAVITPDACDIWTLATAELA